MSVATDHHYTVACFSSRWSQPKSNILKCKCLTRLSPASYNFIFRAEIVQSHIERQTKQKTMIISVTHFLPLSLHKGRGNPGVYRRSL